VVNDRKKIVKNELSIFLGLSITSDFGRYVEPSKARTVLSIVTQELNKVLNDRKISCYEQFLITIIVNNAKLNANNI